ncbi:MAG: LmeA family phospholipid-binding protein [Fimbriimonadaceae bacterium]|nr:LmeA family phospholipid-binding protein [Fimbriimonadaceae bacterium]QYK59427.1 MAG: LmeA family phospholipid-binding protein [Fimbriimonadaceae bacterium]
MDHIRAASASLQASGIVLSVGLELDSFVLSLGALKVDFKPLGFSHDQPGEFQAVVGYGRLAAFIESKAKGAVRDVTVVPQGETLEIQATAKVVFEVKVTISCRLRVESDKKLFVDLVDVSLPIARGIVQSELDKANPVLDASDWPVDVSIQMVELAEEGVVLSGQAAWRGQTL